MPTPIPAPPALPLLGNMLDIIKTEEGDAGDALKPLERLADQYGPIFKLVIKGKERIFVASYDLFEELCDETRFFKVTGPGLDSINQGPAMKGGKRPPGLFTAPSERDSDWQQAHRILMPAFGPIKIRDMFDEMHDIASQLVLKWARLGSDYRIPVADDFTRLTLDTIALCAMDYRFNSFYTDAMHPFVDAMISTLAAGAARQKIPGFVQKLMVRQNAKIQNDSKFQFDIAEELVRHRRENPSNKKDLLNAMIHGKDPKTGEGMRDDLIASNMITFLIAGHETTSGLLSFAFYNMLKNPSTYFRAQKEVDQVVGRKKVTVDHLKDLHFINAILRETLRLTPTASAFNRGVRPGNSENPPTLGNGKYELERDWSVLCLIGRIQRDPKVWGDDANEFRPERMMDGKFEQLPKAAWKPFGTGLRSCIGRPFAWQEALLVIAMLLQNFDFRLDDPSWELKIKSNLTIKPDGFYMRSSLRKGITTSTLQYTLTSTSDAIDASAVGKKSESSSLGLVAKPLTILYGSNAGTCQSFAQKLAADARSHGYQATINDLDAGVNALPTDQPVVIITSSYEGAPPDNAAQFVAWLESMTQGNSLQAQYAVFGCGHKDWSSTFQRIPTLIDSSLGRLGASRLAELGTSDAAKGNMFSDFDSWLDSKLWPAITARFGVSEAACRSVVRGVDLEVSTKDRASQLQHDVQLGKVTKTGVLTAPNEPEKRFLEIKLPQGMDFQVGDYLSVLPMNPDEAVRRVLAHYSLPQDAVITIKSGGPVTLPENQPIIVYELLKGFVEIAQPATRKNIQTCIELTSDDGTLRILNDLSGPLYEIEVVAKRISVLDLLETHTTITLPFSEFLAMLPPMRPRFYSISSSPLKDSTKCSITYGVINSASLAGTGQFQGVAGNYLRSLRSGDAVQVSVRSAPPAFHLPASDTTPIMMFCNGSGLAPFRGFIEERVIKLASNPGQKLAPALLFIGCRSPDADSLYHEEFAEWATSGAVDVRYAFSRDSSQSKGCKYVQDRMMGDQEDVVSMWRDGAKVFICGSPAMVDGIKMSARAMMEERIGQGANWEQIEGYFGSLRNERIAVDVFA